jgi:hypothetical protein
VLRNKIRLDSIFGWILLLLAMGLFTVQIGYLFLQTRLPFEYVDDRVFYLINILCALCIGGASFLLLSLTIRLKIIGFSVIGLFILVNGVQLVSQKEKSIISISPNFKHVLVIKENSKTGDSRYYRTYYGILARPKENLPFQAKGEWKVDWLANDVAAVTYKATNDTLQSFIGTYGDRGNGLSYYYVGAEIHGQWVGEDMKVVSHTDGISITQNGVTEEFDWDHIEQFGTLAIVLKKNEEAVWTISLNESFQVDSNAIKETVGEISLYKTTLEKNHPVILHKQSDNS